MNIGAGVVVWELVGSKKGILPAAVRRGNEVLLRLLHLWRESGRHASVPFRTIGRAERKGRAFKCLIVKGDGRHDWTRTSDLFHVNGDRSIESTTYIRFQELPRKRKYLKTRRRRKNLGLELGLNVGSEFGRIGFRGLHRLTPENDRRLRSI